MTSRATIRVTMDPDDATQPAYEVRPVTIPRRSPIRPALAIGLAAILIGLVVVKPWGWIGEPRSTVVAIAPTAERTPPAGTDPTAAVTPERTDPDDARLAGHRAGRRPARGSRGRACR